MTIRLTPAPDDRTEVEADRHMGGTLIGKD